MKSELRVSISFDRLNIALDYHLMANDILDSLDNIDKYKRIHIDKRLEMYEDALSKQKVAYDIIIGNKIYSNNNIGQGIISKYKFIEDRIRNIKK